AVGAPRPMKMGTAVSPWRYDAAADHALRPHNLRRPSLLRYAPLIAVGTVSTAVTAYYLAAAATMVFISDMVARLGPRLFATIGAVMMGISLVLIAHIRTTFDLFVAYLAMAPAFAMLTNAAVANILGPWFIEKRGLAVSLALTGGGAGGLAIVPILVWLSGKL